MLIPYSPVIPIEPKWVVSHKSNVQGVEHILATSTALESTSQLLALGLDMFGSTVSPSGRFDVLSEDFNKVQLVATTAGLMLAIGILKPIVGSLAAASLSYTDKLVSCRSNARLCESDGISLPDSLLAASLTARCITSLLAITTSP